MRRAKAFPSLSISQTFTLISVLAVLITLGCVAYALVDMRQALVDQKRLEIKHSVEAAGTIIRGYAERAQKGELSEEDAKKAAVKALEKARFEDGNYFFIYTFDTFGIMHPNPKMVGSRFDTMTDAKGKFLFRELAAAAKAGGGFVDYYWIKPGETEPSIKISYAYAIPEWQWYVGAGLYIKDVDATFLAIAVHQAEVIAPIAAVSSDFIFFLSRRVSRLLFGLTRQMKQLAEGDLDAEIGEQGRSDEIGAMARTVQVFKDNSLALAQSRHDRLRLESETTAEREAREAEKAHESERLQFAILTLATGLEDLASGNLVQRLETPFPDQSEKLRVDFNTSIEKLQRTMLVITAGSQKILSGSGEISSASDNLARRTEQQAASLEETAAALDEITATVRKTALRAEKAHNVVLAAENDAGNSGEVVSQAVEAMGRSRNRRSRSARSSASSTRSRSRPTCLRSTPGSKLRGRRCRPRLCGGRFRSARAGATLGRGGERNQDAHFDIDDASRARRQPGCQNRYGTRIDRHENCGNHRDHLGNNIWRAGRSGEPE